jgi:hypothetical protein
MCRYDVLLPTHCQGISIPLLRVSSIWHLHMNKWGVGPPGMATKQATHNAHMNMPQLAATTALKIVVGGSMSDTLLARQQLQLLAPLDSRILLLVAVIYESSKAGSAC